MRRIMLFLRDDRGSSAAEFALILPIFLLFLLGLIDVGRFAWSFNELEKATQIGARRAVATDIIPGNSLANGLANYSFATGTEQLAQGSVVPKANFPGVHCVGTATSVNCNCKSGGTCAFSTTGDATTFDKLLSRMQQIQPSIPRTGLTIDYDWSGLGFAGDPNFPDVAPIVTVSVEGMQFPLLFMLGTSVALPTSRYSMTLEDGQGTVSN